MKFSILEIKFAIAPILIILLGLITSYWIYFLCVIGGIVLTIVSLILFRKYSRDKFLKFVLNDRNGRSMQDIESAKLAINCFKTYLNKSPHASVEFSLSDISRFPLNTNDRNILTQLRDDALSANNDYDSIRSRIENFIDTLS